MELPTDPHELRDYILYWKEKVKKEDGNSLEGIIYDLTKEEPVND